MRGINARPVTELGIGSWVFPSKKNDKLRKLEIQNSINESIACSI